MSTRLAPISYASSIVGFLSFAFTLLTLLRVSWGAILTIFAAPREAKDYFDNVRQELYELREDLRRTRKRHKQEDKAESKSSKSSMESGSLRVLNDTVKHLQRDFKRLERPFLLVNRDDDRDVDSPWTHYTVYTARINYCNMDLRRRVIWLRSKSEAISIVERIARIQTRRIASEIYNIQSLVGIYVFMRRSKLKLTFD